MVPAGNKAKCLSSVHHTTKTIYHHHPHHHHHHHQYRIWNTKWPPTWSFHLYARSLPCLFSMLLYIVVAEVLASFINPNKMIKGIQIGDHEIKIVNFADDTTIFIRGITCLNRMQVILKLYEEASSSKINVSKS